MPPEDKLPIQLTDRTIYIIGPRRLQNRLLCDFLGQETGATCIEAESPGSILGSYRPSNDSQPALFLWDCCGNPLETLLLEWKQQEDPLPEGCFVAPFNLNPLSGNEEKALERGVRGFFYEQDSPEQLLKGIRAIFSNELWVSREILTKCILENRGKAEEFKKDSNLLTPREIEILTMIAAGIKNEGIADKLCISPHTVRTHIYNIFKKINVPNRLQAALWAVQNL